MINFTDCKEHGTILNNCTKCKQLADVEFTRHQKSKTITAYCTCKAKIRISNPDYPVVLNNL